MIPLILTVMAISISGVMAPGPMFAVTVAKSYHSPWAGAKISIGHAVVEVPLILVIYFGFATFFEIIIVQILLSLIGGAMIVWMGIGMFRSRREVTQEGRDLKYGAVTAGIVMSITNPFFLLWWATVGSLLVMRFKEFGLIGIPVFIFVHWVCDLIWLSFVSVVIYKTRSLWGKHLQEIIFIICALLLAGFGTWFIVAGLQLIF